MTDTDRKAIIRLTFTRAPALIRGGRCHELPTRPAS